MNYKYVLIAMLCFAALPFSAVAAVTHPGGTLINDQGTIWHITSDGKTRQGFDSAEKFLSHRFSFNQAVSAYTTDLALPSQINPDWGNGVLFNDSGTIYQVSGNAKHGFASAAVFLTQGFQFSSAIPGNLRALPKGSVITNGQQKHLPGTFVRESNGTIWYVSSATQRLGIPSMSVFTSYHVPITDVVPMNTADQTLATAGLLPYLSGTVINDNGALWFVNQPNAYPFASAECFTNFGYTFGQAISGSISGLTRQPPICGEINYTSRYDKETIATARGTFTVHVAKFNVASGKIKVMTDVAADVDCIRECAAAPLASYLTANNATAGINGTYFCPPDYTGCQQERNYFFWKVYDTQQKEMINANSGLGENDPFLVLGTDGKLKYFSRWIDGEDYPMTAGINSGPALISDSKIVLNEAKLDSKQLLTKSYRGAIGVKGQVLYLAMATNATVPDLATIMQSLGVDYAMNIDGGGSAALMYENQYKVGPGRALPNALVVQVLP